MAQVRILADDLTGALDTAARFLPLAGPMPVFWRPPAGALPGSAAIDAGTRELTESEAAATVRRLSPLLAAEVSFKKLDSLLRGHPAAEIGACLRQFDHSMIAPAFPFQQRITRNGRQMVRVAEDWEDSRVDLAAGLTAAGFAPRLQQSGERPVAGVSLWDAESDNDLAEIVAAGRRLGGRVLWCGSGGLAGAIADGLVPPPPPLPWPVLALIGSDHPASIAQLSAAWAHVHRIVRGDADEAAPVARRLGRSSAAAVTVSLPPGVGRGEAGKHIARCFGSVLQELDPPGSLFVSGGETLRMVCDILGADYLEVDGEIVPGVPTSVMRGGRWDGISVISKSGAFGDAGLLLRMLMGRNGADGDSGDDG
jgi:D-threonate/D-erythronate kinase